MQQVLFHIPILERWFPPDGIPMYGFGAMLFVCFLVVTLWGSVRARRTAGMPPERFQDMVIFLFVAGLIGARILFMIQYSRDFNDKSPLGLFLAFFRIWEGGIIFYGSALGGVLGYGLFYWFFMRRLRVNGWQLADAVAPLLAVGLAIGRIGCYLNGCCWGQAVCEECRPVPLGAAHFPLLSAHARTRLVSMERDQTTPGYLQTTTGFTLEPRQQFPPDPDPRGRVRAVEVGSPAERAGVKPGDRVVRVNGKPEVPAEDRPNSIFLDLRGSAEEVKEALAAHKDVLKDALDKVAVLPDGATRLEFDDPAAYRAARQALRGTPGVDLSAPVDRLDQTTDPRNWPRGRSKLGLTVERTGPDGRAEVVALPAFAPVTVGLYPTQLYETVSMVLLILLLLAYYPYRRHDGELMVLLMMGYGVHRFINESLRIEPVVGTGLTLSQWGSVLIFAAAVGIEIFLWRTMPSRWGRGGSAPVLAPAPAPPAHPGTPAPTVS